MNIKLFLATPAFGGNVTCHYASSLADTILTLAKLHIQVQLKLVTSSSLLCAERNRLLKAFVESDCTHMLCIDADIGWPAQAVVEMIRKQEDFVGGCYPARGDKSFFFRPTLMEDDKIKSNGKGLLSMQYIPAGFMLLTRNLIEKVIKDHPETAFNPKDPAIASGHAIFNTEVHDNEFWGEDYVFCRRVRESGFEIWVDPLIQFDHAGNVGMLMELLTDKKPENITKT